MPAASVHTRRVTLQDVADEAGVSLKTASNVLNDRGRMSPGTRQKVRDVIERLGYKVDATARTMRTGRSGIITLALPTMKDPYIGELTQSFIEKARDLGYGINVNVFRSGSGFGARYVLRSFNVTQSDGLIIMLPQREDVTADDLDVDYPLVCIGSREVWGRCNKVMMDELYNAKLAMDYLLDRGARQPAIIGAYARRPLDEVRCSQEGTAWLRMRGLLEECDRFGVPVDDDMVGVTGYEWKVGNGYAAMSRILDAGRRPDSVVCLSDWLAIGVIASLAAHGIAIPDEVQLISFGNTEESMYLHPSLTSVDSTMEEFVDAALTCIVDSMGGTCGSPRRICIPSRVVSRSSTR